MKTQCSYCCVRSHNQREGDGCHSCGRGWMVQVCDDIREHQRGYFGYASGMPASKDGRKNGVSQSPLR